MIWDSGDLLGSNWKGQPTSSFWIQHLFRFSDRNPSQAEYRFAGKSWNEWRQAGRDSHSRLQIHLLVDPAQPSWDCAQTLRRFRRFCSH